MSAGCATSPLARPGDSIAAARGTLVRMDDAAAGRSRPRPVTLLAGAAIALAVVLVAGAAFLAWREIPRGSIPDGDPPVLAGRQLWGSCAAGFYARRGETLVLTSSAHCAREGMTATDPDGTGVRGVFGPAAVLDPCEHTDHTCRPSDINYIVVAADRIPWGRLNVVDMGDGGTRVLEAGTRPLRCGDIERGDHVEINGRDRFRTGTVTEIGAYLHDVAADGDYFPCMVVADIEVGVGDSGGAVLVEGVPAGVTSRGFGGAFGFTPLAEGLEALGLELCATPDCGLTPPPASRLPRAASRQASPGATATDGAAGLTPPRSAPPGE